MPATDDKPILILGAGINGAALAREFLLNGQSVVVVDQADVASGATAYSSRLIHGGLRYLEYGEFSLVRESLAERTRLLRLAPQFVHPLQLFIPVENRLGGLVQSAAKFLHLDRFLPRRKVQPSRGEWLVRMGLRFYDTYAQDKTLPRHRAHRLTEPGVPRLNQDRFHAAVSYFDGQINYPERFVVALLEDARRIAAEQGLRCDIHTYCRAELTGNHVTVKEVRTPAAEVVDQLEVAAVMNATGAWVDLTLAKLDVPSRTLMGGTKGSHLVTAHAELRRALDGNGIYAEAADGRPVFILPYGESTLIGTTDVPFSGDPANAVTSPEEVDYLLATVNTLVPDVNLTVADVDMHYSGVRPLPYVHAASTGAITRRHWLEENKEAAVPFYSVIGGKLTTCRSLAEEGVREVLPRLGKSVIATSQERPLPGAAGYSRSRDAQRKQQAELSAKYGVPETQVRGMWQLCGGQVSEILEQLQLFDTEPLDGCHLPRGFVRWAIRYEGARTIMDLVERRLMLIHHPVVSEQLLRQLAALLREEGRLTDEDTEAEIQAAINRLQRHFGRQIPATADE